MGNRFLSPSIWWLLVSFVLGVLSVCVVCYSKLVSWGFLEGAAVVGFLGFLESKKGWSISEVEDAGCVFYLVQVLGSVGLGGYVFLDEGTAGYLCLVGGLSLKMGASVFHPWVLYMSKWVESDEGFTAFGLMLISQKIGPLGWLVAFAGSEGWWGSSAIWVLGLLSFTWGLLFMGVEEKVNVLGSEARSLAWVSCNGVSWLFVGVGSGSWLLLVLCCVVHLYEVSVKLWCRDSKGANNVKFNHLSHYSFLKLLVVLWMFYTVSLVPSLSLFPICVVIGYVWMLWGELLWGEV